MTEEKRLTHSPVANTETTTNITQVGTVIIPVSDQDRALDFYLGLGFEKRMDAPYGEGERWVEVAPPRQRSRWSPRVMGIPAG